MRIRKLRHGTGFTLLALSGLLVGCTKGDGLSDFQRQKLAQENAGVALEEMGGKAREVHTNFKGVKADSWSVDLGGREINEQVFDRIKELGNLSELNLSKTNVTDEDMTRLNDLGVFLLKLDLSHTAVSDAGLDKLTKLAILRDLNLVGTRVTPDGVARFQKRRQDDPNIWPLFKSPTIRLK
jgi:hypothetical protein